MGQLLGLCGSLRAGSFNRKLMHQAAKLFDPDAFVEGDLRLPLYDGDLEATDGVPAAVQTLSDQIAAANAVVIAGPEYNKGVSGVLKNGLDWISRTKGGPWRDKPVAIMSATAGRAGGERTQSALRLCLVPFRPRLLNGPEVLVAQAQAQFDEAGTLTNEINYNALVELMADLRQAAGLS
ncbi:MAG: NAD(P)H-dependent oxidoreductase [Pseudomonadota bacterium]